MQIKKHEKSAKLSQNGRVGVCVFLTATLTPPPSAVSRNDPNVRLQDYIASLEYYLSLPPSIVDRVLFVDNSGSDISTIENFVRSRIDDKTVELISFDGNNHPVSYGKAYGEFKLMDFGLNHTSLLGEDDYFWKVTGRLRVLNFSEVTTTESDYDLWCDLYNFPLIGTGRVFGNRWMDLRLFSCTKRSYGKLFAHKYEELGPLINQNTLYDVVIKARDHMRILPRFARQPVISGISGRHSRDYDSGFQGVKTIVRSKIRTLAPCLWI